MFNHHSIIPGGSFRGRREEKWGSFQGCDHFGVMRSIWGSFRGLYSTVWRKPLSVSLYFYWATWNNRKKSLKQYEVESIPQRRVYWCRRCRIVRSKIGSFRNDDGETSIFQSLCVFFFKVCRNYYNWTHFDCQMFVYFPGIEILETEHDLRRRKKSLVAVLCSCVYVCFRPPQTSRLGFSCCSRAVTAKGACCTWILHVQSCCFAY